MRRWINELNDIQKRLQGIVAETHECHPDLARFDPYDGPGNGVIMCELEEFVQAELFVKGHRHVQIANANDGVRQSRFSHFT